MVPVRVGITALGLSHVASDMVKPTERDGATWYECERCGMVFEDETEAKQHERACDAEDPTYLQ